MVQLFAVALLLVGATGLHRDDPIDDPVPNPIDDPVPQNRKVEKMDAEMDKKKEAMKHYKKRLMQYMVEESSPYLCNSPATVDKFDMTTYISLPWYSQRQLPTLYNNFDTLKCVRAQYRMGTDLGNGYTIEVNNQADNIYTGEKGIAKLCAKAGSGTGRLIVAPCEISSEWGGPYWVHHYEEGDDGFVVVSSGDPYLPTLDTGRNGGGWNCGYLPILDGGLWFMSRKPRATDAVREKAKGIIDGLGLSWGSMMDVQQPDSCVYKDPW